MNIVSIVACGGKGRRLGGDKPSRELGGIALVDRAIALATSFGGPVALAVRKGQNIPTCNFEQLIDQLPDAGPVSALASGFRFAASQGASHILMIGCDQPFLPTSLAQCLIAAIGHGGAAVPVSLGRDQYMAALWRVDPVALDRFTGSGGRALWRYAASVGMVRVPWPDNGGPDDFADIDDRPAFEAAERRLRSDPR